MRKPAFLLILIWVLISQSTHSQTPLKMRDASVKGPQTFAIIMGVSKYKFVRPLAYADKDAELFRDYLKSPGGGSVKEENIFCLLNEQALNSNFWTKGFQWLRAKQLQKGDKLFIYLAGHGDAIDEDQFFFLSYDCNPEGDKNNYLVSGTIQLYNLKKKIAAETAKGVEVIFIMDACRTNELPGGTAGQNFLNTAISEKKAGEIIMLATGAGQESLEDVSIGNGHGLFTWYLVDGLSGVADDSLHRDNKVSFEEIKSYVDKNVPSVAQQRFRRKQDPYFCCNENSEKVISMVDTAYLSKWLKQKKQQPRRGGNSFAGERIRYTGVETIDTSLIETYNRFNQAVKTKKIAGASSAEDFFAQLNKKFPGNPYTLDAKSTLAVEYINEAQARVDEYLSCSEASARKKQANYQAGLRLQKAIDILQEDDPDFAQSLRGRMHLLKASGDLTNGENGDINTAFQHAWAAQAIDKNGAYIQNRLAQLHLENNRLDSAKYYAEKATRTAPNWRCAMLTLALVQNTANNKPDNKPDEKKKKPNTGTRKVQIGGVLGGGMSQLDATPVTPTANDRVFLRDVQNKLTYNLGLIAQINLGNLVSIRPSVLATMESSDYTFETRGITGGSTTEIVPVKTTTVSLPLPIIIRFSKKNISPFISAGPTFSLLMQKKDANAEKVGLTTSDILGDAGIGVDIGFLKSHLVISPELKYSRGLTSVKENQNTIYSNAINKINRQTFTFSVYLRAR
ncbi:MAG: caspase family protein [Bacteroidetes bacterium]|nr:caspase family protein [Bacteroidota bacterium]